jgi:hypothetical protein
MPRKKSKQTFCFRGFHQKCNFQYAFDDNLSVTHVLLSKSSGL